MSELPPDPSRTEAPFELAELARRVAQIVRPGRVDEVDAGRALVRVRWDVDADGAPVVTNWRPWLPSIAGAARSWRAPSAGEQVVLLSPDGDIAQSFVLPALYSDASPAPSDDPDKVVVRHADGAVVEYDAAAHVLRHTAQDGAVLTHDAAAHALSAVLGAGATAALDAPGGVSIVGDVAVTGSISATGDVSDAAGSMEEMRDVYNPHTHPSASPPSPTGAAIQKM